jgi:hypothetical protein
MSTRSRKRMFLGSRVWQVRLSDNLTAICKPIVLKMWDPVRKEVEQNISMTECTCIVSESVMYLSNVCSQSPHKLICEQAVHEPHELTQTFKSPSYLSAEEYGCRLSRDCTFIIVFTGARHCSIFWAILVQAHTLTLCILKTINTIIPPSI